MKNSRATGTSEQTPDTFLSDLRALVTEAQKILDASNASESEDNGEHGTALRERFEAARERFTELYATAKKRVVAGGKYADETIRENPYQSIAVAAGVGLLIGILVGRRGK
ncbi:MAG TPA: hypothetical protein VN775_12725 [Opitutaceae bacterium]|nr:hypothetical protein [Opitutaceae bacterium]